MTTASAAAPYLAQHQAAINGRPVAVFNPHGLPVALLPVIYGFNNGGSRGWFQAELLAADGTYLGGHVCSDEGYMPHDLGVLEGCRPDRHEAFRAHYPEGYRMAFLPYGDAKTHPGLQEAIRLCIASQDQNVELRHEG